MLNVCGSKYIQFLITVILFGISELYVNSDLIEPIAEEINSLPTSQFLYDSGIDTILFECSTSRYYYN